MRKLIAIGLLLNALLLAGRFWQEMPSALGQTDPGTARENGDCNGDGERDISDAIHLLGYLFTGGPPPAALAESDPLNAEQREILGLFSLVQLPVGSAPGSPTVKTLRLSGANLQIVNGSNQTDITNGLGNLIVGYQEMRGDLDFRTGSHNLIVGLGHSYSSFGGFLAGLSNTVEAPLGSVSGGTLNVVSGRAAAVAGGRGNRASGIESTVGGGLENEARGGYSSVGGGRRGKANGDISSISGGLDRSVEGFADWRAGSLFDEG